MINSLRAASNPKSALPAWHYVDSSDWKSLSKYYSLDTRICNSVVDYETGRIVPNKDCWIQNEILFDFDVYSKEDQDNALKKCIDIIGIPSKVIYNSNNYDERDLTDYFSKKMKYPKEFGFQVLYTLEIPMSNATSEYNKIIKETLKALSEEVGSDPAFQNRLFKNYYNRHLFNVEFNNNPVYFDIAKFAKKYLGISDSHWNIVMDWTKGAWAKKTDQDNFNPTAFMEFWSNNSKQNIPISEQRIALVDWYTSDINSYTRPKKKTVVCNFNITSRDRLSTFTDKSTSRNETMFNFATHLSNRALFDCYNYIDDVLDSDIFNMCDIKERMDKEEALNIVRSVMAYRRLSLSGGDKYCGDMSDEPVIVVDKSNISPVLKLEQESQNHTFFFEFYNFVESVINDSDKAKELISSICKQSDWICTEDGIFVSPSSEYYRYDTDNRVSKDVLYAKIMVELCMQFGGDKVLSNISNLCSIPVYSYLTELYTNLNCDCGIIKPFVLQMIDSYNFTDLAIDKDTGEAIYLAVINNKIAMFIKMLHFRYLNSVKKGSKTTEADYYKTSEVLSFDGIPRAEKMKKLENYGVYSENYVSDASLNAMINDGVINLDDKISATYLMTKLHIRKSVACDFYKRLRPLLLKRSLTKSINKLAMVVMSNIKRKKDEFANYVNKLSSDKTNTIADDSCFNDGYTDDNSVTSLDIMIMMLYRLVIYQCRMSDMYMLE